MYVQLGLLVFSLTAVLIGAFYRSAFVIMCGGGGLMAYYHFAIKSESPSDTGPDVKKRGDSETDGPVLRMCGLISGAIEGAIVGIVTCFLWGRPVELFGTTFIAFAAGGSVAGSILGFLFPREAIVLFAFLGG